MARTIKAVPIVLPSRPVVSSAETWSIHIGNIRIFIIGPGEDDWFPASPANYGKPVASKQDLRIAQHAVRILNATHRETHNIGQSAFDAVMHKARKQAAA